ncbi:MAG: MarR family winged helix-turn-helix transcriptional regulator [Bacteroidales bacterium]
MQYHFDHSLGRITQQISRALGKRFEQKCRNQGIRIRPDQWTVISLLFHKGSMPQNKIGDLLYIDKVAVSRTIERLEERNLVVQEVPGNDKRMRMVKLTSSGTEIYHQLSPLAGETITEALEDLKEDETSQLFESLEKIKIRLGC